MMVTEFLDSKHTYQRPSIVKPEVIGKPSASLATEMNARAAKDEAIKVTLCFVGVARLADQIIREPQRSRKTTVYVKLKKNELIDSKTRCNGIDNVARRNYRPISNAGKRGSVSSTARRMTRRLLNSLSPSRPMISGSIQ